ncbi:MAG: hypothetical protein AB7H81_17625, partial [Vicinamibacterales bacterium]
MEFGAICVICGHLRPSASSASSAAICGPSAAHLRPICVREIMSVSRFVFAAFISVTCVPSSWAQQASSQGAASSLPAALVAMAETERAFSRRASETTPREAFIEFFADESVSFQPDPGPARERLRKQPLPKPGTPAFQWEPRTGDVAASGDLGYLTGPVRYPQPDGSVRHGCYFSVWKKQADGS